jgi:hypothetical protein
VRASDEDESKVPPSDPKLKPHPKHLDGIPEEKKQACSEAIAKLTQNFVKSYIDIEKEPALNDTPLKRVPKSAII